MIYVIHQIKAIAAGSTTVKQPRCHSMAFQYIYIHYPKHPWHPARSSTSPSSWPVNSSSQSAPAGPDHMI